MRSRGIGTGRLPGVAVALAAALACPQLEGRGRLAELGLEVGHRILFDTGAVLWRAR